MGILPQTKPLRINVLGARKIIDAVQSKDGKAEDRKARIVRDDAVIAKADGQWLAGTDERAQRGPVRAVLDQLLSIILDLVSQGHRVRPA